MTRAILTVMLFCSLSAAQDKYIELSKSDMESKKMTLISTVLNLNDEEAAKFWPIYHEYETERDRIGKKEIDLLTRYVESYESMSDEVLDEIAYLSFELDQEMIDLKRTYYDRLKNIISLKNAARFIQIENQLQSIIDFQVSSQIPLIK